MDNTDLEFLKIKPGALTPAFSNSNTAYTVTLPSATTELGIDALTEDSGASLQVHGDLGGRRVALPVGRSEIVLEITAEDGSTTKKIVIKATRLAPNATAPSELRVVDAAGAAASPAKTAKKAGKQAVPVSGSLASGLRLDPAFRQDILSYTALAPASCTAVLVQPALPDPKMVARVQGSDGSATPTGTPQLLQQGETPLALTITSPDGSASQTYSITVIRNGPASRLRPVGGPAAAKLCPLCLNIPHRPRTIKDCDKGLNYCAACLALLTRTSKVAPVDRMPLRDADWLQRDATLEDLAANCKVHCPHRAHGCPESCRAADASAHAAACLRRPAPCETCGDLVPAGDREVHAQTPCTQTCKACDRAVPLYGVGLHQQLCSAANDFALAHKAAVRDWEKALSENSNSKEINADNILKESKKQVETYLKRLQRLPRGATDPELQSILNATAAHLAAGLQQKPKEARLHAMLGQVFEELFFLSERVQAGSQASGDDDDDDSCIVDQGSAQTKEDDIAAICVLHGGTGKEGTAAVLQILNKEFQQLKSRGAYAKADYVQGLFLWKSKKEAGAGGQAVAERDVNRALLLRAAEKYLDARQLDVQSFDYNLGAGRLLLQLGRTTEALTCLQAAVGLRPVDAAAQFFLGSAMAQLDCGEAETAVQLLDRGFSHLMQHKMDMAGTGVAGAVTLAAEQPLNPSSTEVVSALLLRADKLAAVGGGDDAARAAYMDTIALIPSILYEASLKNTSTYRVFEMTLFEAHSRLVQHLIARNMELTWAKELAERLNRLCESSTIGLEPAMLDLQLKNARRLARLEPNSSAALCNLGFVQVHQYDHDPSLRMGSAKPPLSLLTDAEASFRASMAVEGQPVAGSSAPEQLRRQSWWSTEESSKAPAAAGAGTSGSGTKGKAAVSGNKARGAAGPATRGARASPGTAGRAGAAASSRTTAGPAKSTATSSKAPAAASRSSPARAGAGRAASTAAKGSSASSTAAKRNTGSTTSRATAASKPAAGATSVRGAKATPPTRGGKAPTGRAVGTTAKAPTSTSKPTSAFTRTNPSGTGAKAKTGAAGAASGGQDKDSPPNPGADAGGSASRTNPVSFRPRLGLARVLARKLADEDKADVNEDEMCSLYQKVIEMCPSDMDAYIELGEHFLAKKATSLALDLYETFPFHDPPTVDDSFLHGEIVRVLMREKLFSDERLKPHLISLGKVMGLPAIEGYVQTLDDQFKYTKMLREVYAAINGKDVDHPDLQAFFKFKCWL